MKSIKNPLTSSEIGNLWLTYQEKTLILRILEYFIERADDKQAKNIMGGLWQDLSHYTKKMEHTLQNEGAVIPKGFQKEDVNIDAPKLFENGFDIMFIRVLKEISMGMYTLNMNMSYRDDIISLYENLTSMTQKTYKISTEYLLEKGILTIPPKVNLPKSTEFIEGKSYLSGFNPFSEKRTLNDIEIGNFHHGIETNNIGMQLMEGFSQCAVNDEVKDYFTKGKKLAKKQIEIFEKILLDSDIQSTASSGSSVTTSTIAPFSDKLMMFCVYLLNGFGIVGSSFGSIFTLRNDLSLKTSLIAKDIFTYARDGVNIMIKNGWMEEPPQKENKSK